MDYLSGSEILLYAGIAVMCVAAAGMVVCAIMFKMTGKNKKYT